MSEIENEFLRGWASAQGSPKNLKPLIKKLVDDRDKEWGALLRKTVEHLPDDLKEEVLAALAQVALER